ncbi:hypothetical protein HK104_001529 [Borealophlyctis nickersoniae]|nr:hypothetical protein HK104_001529 [Borealophlyctis nickersoniae]
MGNTSRTFLRIAPHSPAADKTQTDTYTDTAPALGVLFFDPISTDTEDGSYASASSSPVPLYISCHWRDNEVYNSAFVVEITVTDGDMVWQRKVSRTDLTRQRPQDFDESDFMEATRAALAGRRGPRGQETKCRVERGDFTAEDRCEELQEKVKTLQEQKAEVLRMHEEWVHEKKEEVDRVIFRKGECERKAEFGEITLALCFLVTKVAASRPTQFKEVLNSKKAKIRALMAANAKLAKEHRALQQALEEASRKAKGKPQVMEVEDAMEIDELAPPSSTDITGAAGSSRPISPSSKRRKTGRESSLRPLDQVEDEREVPLQRSTAAKAQSVAEPPTRSRAPDPDRSSDSDDLEPPALFGGPPARSFVPAKRYVKSRVLVTKQTRFTKDYIFSRHESHNDTRQEGKPSICGGWFRKRSSKSVASNLSEDADALIGKM